MKAFAKARPKAIVLVSRNETGLGEVRHEIHAINKDVQVEILPTDIKNAESVASFWEKVKGKFGHADVLINNAASVGGGTVSEQPIESWWNDFVSGMLLFRGELTYWRKQTSEGHSSSPKDS